MILARSELQGDALVPFTPRRHSLQPSFVERRRRSSMASCLAVAVARLVDSDIDTAIRPWVRTSWDRDALSDGSLGIGKVD